MRWSAAPSGMWPTPSLVFTHTAGSPMYAVPDGAHTAATSTDGVRDLRSLLRFTVNCSVIMLAWGIRHKTSKTLR